MSNIMKSYISVQSDSENRFVESVIANYILAGKMIYV